MLDPQTTNLLLQFEENLQSCRSENQLFSLYEKSKNLNNPHVDYRIGETFYINFNDNMEALPFFISGASYGLDPKNSFYSNHLSNSIGQCYKYLLNNYVFGYTLEFKICCLV